MLSTTMRRGTSLLVAYSFCVAVSAGEFDDRIAREASRIESQVIDWRRTFHEDPERPNEEHETARIIAEHLDTLGLDHVVTGVARTGVVGILRGGRPGPTVALRADIDAVDGVTERNDLPFRSAKENVAHLCGHDGHTAILMGVANVLNQVKDELAGNVMFVFQPAEELVVSPPEYAGESSGALLMLEEGIFSEDFLQGRYQPSAVFGLHFLPRDMGEVSYVSGSRLYSGDWPSFIVRETDVPANDGGRTRGNELYSAVARLIDALAEFPTEPDGIDVPVPSFFSLRSVHSVENVDNPDLGQAIEIAGWFGAATHEAREHGTRWFEEVANRVSSETGMEISMSRNPYAPPVINDPQLVQLMRPSMVNAVGEANLSETPYFFPAADDMALFQQEVPGIYIFLGVNAEGVRTGEAPFNHSPEFFVNEDVLVTGVKFLSTLAADYLQLQESRN